MDNMAGEMEVDEVDVNLKPVAFWQLHKNPILLRYMRSRLRWSGLSAALILTLVVTVFTFLISFNLALPQALDSSVNAYRAAFLPVFLIQVIIMMFLGTGAVASGITQEFEDGMVEYQRLSPMSPMAKIVGYLFGLPIREWFLLGVTSLFIGYIVMKGRVPLDSVWHLYSVFFLSIILYHLMALVVVQSMKKKRVAGRVIQFLVVVLYFVFPLLSQFGLVFFEYLTVRPILKESILEHVPKGRLKDLLGLDGGTSTVPFFEHQLKAWSFSVVLMSSLSISFLLMLSRRWRDVTSHLMSKVFGLVFFGFLMFFLIGNTLPIAKVGDMSITKSVFELQENTFLSVLEDPRTNYNMRQRAETELKKLRNKSVRLQPAVDGPVAQTVFGVVCVLFACLVVYVVTPKNEKYLLGLRRARNLKKRWIPVHWDEAPGLLSTLCVMGMMGWTLYTFSATLYQAPTMNAKIRDLVPFIPVVCVFAAVVVLVFYLVFEAWENRGLFLLILFVWVMPIMVAMVMSTQSSSWSNLIWVSSVSPVVAYGYGMSDAVVVPVREAFYFSFGLQILIGGFAGMALFTKKMRGRRVLLENSID